MNSFRRIKSHRDFTKPTRWWRPRRSGGTSQPIEPLKRFSYADHHRRALWRLVQVSAPRVIGLMVVFGFVFFSIMVLWTSHDLPDPNRLLERKIEQTTTIYDRTGEQILYQLHGDVNRRLIQLTDLPDYMKWATITAEDRQFYEHSGFSIKGIVRSLFSNLFNSTQVGGSTITQQFVKNAILTNEKTYTRKIRELILAYRIEHKFTKDQILQLYFNEIPYGSVIYGVEAASESFFGKSAKDLTIGQAAVLAAIPQRPTYFSPYGSHLDRLFERQRYIINSMVDLGYITAQQGEVAKAEQIEFKPRAEAMTAPHFVMYVRELLAEEYGEQAAAEAGFKVTTTLDAKLQKIAEEAVTNQVAKNWEKYQAGNAALVSLDTKTGQILAMVGSADFHNEDIDGQVNVVLRPRQPGSSFKPLAYASAFEKGYGPDTLLYDVITTFPTDTGTPYEPHNYDGGEHGPVTMRQALAGSLNIPAVKTLYLAGIDHVLDNAEKLGYTTLSDRSRFGLSLVLGGGEVTLLEHTAAYAAFAREGEYHEPLGILKIEDADGKVLYEYKPSDNRGRSTIDPDAVKKLTSVLTDNAARTYIFGEKNYLTLADRPVAAKTGTTNDYHDAWTMGYTPSLATGVWVGNSDNKAMKRGADGSVVAAPIWNAFMRQATANQPVEGFNPPPENTATKPVLRGGTAGTALVKIDSATGRAASVNTPPEQVVEKAMPQHHTILFYVNRDDPSGPPPSDPFDDPMFPYWEDAVRQWAERNGFVQIPTNLADRLVDIDPASKPTIIIDAPRAGDTITAEQLPVAVTVAAPRGLRQVEYRIDDQVIGTATNAPYGGTWSLADIASGVHTLTAIVTDAAGASASSSIDLNFLLPENNATPKFSWTAPSANAVLNSDAWPIALTGTLTFPGRVDRIDFLAATNGQAQVITQIEQPSISSISVPWPTAPKNGTYQLYTLLFRKNGGIVRGPEITVTVK